MARDVHDDQTAFPTSQAQDHIDYEGLTKREYLAALALQGILSADLPPPAVLCGLDESTTEYLRWQPPAVAAAAVAYADALMAELAK